MTKNVVKIPSILTTLSLLLLVGVVQAETKTKALIIDGQNNHGMWPKTTVMMKKYLEETGLFVGQHVNHARFGDGVVLNLEGQGAQSRVQVNFEKEGSKWLIASMANLQPV